MGNGEYQVKEVQNKKEWDSGLNQFEYSTHFDSWAWGEFERMQGNQFKMLGIYNGDAIVGLVPAKFVIAKRGKYIHLRHAPLIDWDNGELVDFALDYIKKFAKEQGFPFVRMSPLINGKEENSEKLQKLGLKKAPVHATDAELTVVVDLTLPEEEILKQMRKNTRYDVKKGSKLGVEVQIYEDLSRFDAFKEVYLDSLKRQKWTGYSLEYIKHEFETFAKYGDARLVVADYKGKPISASMFIIHRNQVIYHHSGSATEFRNIPSTHLLHWEAIKYFKEMGLELYNFWGVCEEDALRHPWYGLSLFKRGFTKKELRFIHPHDMVISPVAYATRFYEWFEKKRRGY